MFATVVILALVVVLPSIRAYLRQDAELDELRGRVEDANTEVEDLTAEVARWDDSAHVIAEARERLGYVLPGEKPYRVIDPEAADDAPPGGA